MTAPAAAAPHGWPRALAEHREAVDAFARAAAALTPDEWRRPRAEGKWCPAEEAVHVVRSYELVRDELAGGQGMRLRLSPWRAALLRWLVLPRILRSGRLPLRVRAPSELRPPAERCASAVPAATAEQLRAIAAEFERGAEALALAGSRRRFTHPFFGGLDVVTGVRFMTIHTRHHLVNLPDARRAGPPRSSH